MVAPVHEDALRLPELEQQDQDHDVHGATSPVADVAVEEVHVLRRGEPVLEEDPEHVRELPVRVADDDQPARRGRARLDHGLGVLHPVRVRELRREVADVLRVQRVGLPVQQVKVHQLPRVLEGHGHFDPEARVAVADVDVVRLCRRLPTVLMLLHLLGLDPLPSLGVRGVRLAALLVGGLQVRRHGVAHRGLLDEARLVSRLALKQPGEGLRR
mmetsp:Transcript_89179/g.277247  ORF Transcript_89179/g.277247 Transcript_89179/m.277247 type:complete len:214 (-) Transcript_89179:174-815(-)